MTNEFNHEPQDYHCPFCALLEGHYNDRGTREDIVYQNKFATAKIAPKWWVNNPGHVLVVPNKHYENIYDIPEDILAEVYQVAQKLRLPCAKHMIAKAHQCVSTMNRQAIKMFGISMFMSFRDMRMTIFTRTT